mgnify:CR=1 FL=1
MNITVSITELLQAVGSENIRFQSMSTSMEHINEELPDGNSSQK